MCDFSVTFLKVHLRGKGLNYQYNCRKSKSKTSSKRGTEMICAEDKWLLTSGSRWARLHLLVIAAL